MPKATHFNMKLNSTVYKNNLQSGLVTAKLLSPS